MKLTKLHQKVNRANHVRPKTDLFTENGIQNIYSFFTEPMVGNEIGAFQIKKRKLSSDLGVSGKEENFIVLY